MSSTTTQRQLIVTGAAPTPTGTMAGTTDATTSTPATTGLLLTGPRLLTMAGATRPAGRGAQKGSAALKTIIATGIPAIPRPPMICSVRISGHSVAAVQVDRLPPADCSVDWVDTVECPRTTTTADATMADTTAVTASLT